MAIVYPLDYTFVKKDKQFYKRGLNNSGGRSYNQFNGSEDDTFAQTVQEDTDSAPTVVGDALVLIADISHGDVVESIKIKASTALSGTYDIVLINKDTGDYIYRFGTEHAFEPIKLASAISITTTLTEFAGLNVDVAPTDHIHLGTVVKHTNIGELSGYGADLPSNTTIALKLISATSASDQVLDAIIDVETIVHEDL